jgi:hypothetical protein
LENEAKNGTTPTAKRKMMEQVRNCRTKWTSLKTALEKEILVGDARAGKSPDSSKDATTVSFVLALAYQSSSNDSCAVSCFASCRRSKWSAALIESTGEMSFKHFACRAGRPDSFAACSWSELDAISTKRSAHSRTRRPSVRLPESFGLGCTLLLISYNFDNLQRRMSRTI